MVVVYVALIVAGRKTFDQVPDILKEKVKTELEALDLGDPAIAQVRYDMSANACAVTNTIQSAARDITDNQNANYRALHDEIVAIRMEDKNAQIAALQSQVQALNLAQSQANQNQYLINTLRPCPTPAYITCNPWAGQAAYGSCGTAYGYGCGTCC